MLSTVLIVGFIGVSFFSALTLFAACIAVGRTSPMRVTVERHRPAVTAHNPSIIDVQWRRLDEQPAV